MPKHRRKRSNPNLGVALHGDFRRKSTAPNALPPTLQNVLRVTRSEWRLTHNTSRNETVVAAPSEEPHDVCVE